MPSDAHEDVARLDVAVIDRRVVRGAQAGAELDHEIELAFDRHRVALLQEVLERRPAQQLHDDEETVAVFADVEDRDDVRM